MSKVAYMDTHACCPVEALGRQNSCKGYRLYININELPELSKNLSKCWLWMRKTHASQKL